ncbi:hypothetical protein PL8927_140190 [Planktothrix serta PCC 8927]|uniref:Uncharacterized protein n=1 Tax=Planktothrix serta PCC 8927 TaxID=671068 RepID=A0A7Z9BMA4_9CYAN|nr:hypothetical protein PL8927_140190 [Planktothrix serta PCC 8927]
MARLAPTPEIYFKAFSAIVHTNGGGTQAPNSLLPFSLLTLSVLARLLDFVS